MAYASLTDLKSWLKIDDSEDDALLSLALANAESAIDRYTERTFVLSSTQSATARTYGTRVAGAVWVDDIGDTTGLIVKIDDNDNGVFETTLTLGTDFVLDPPTGQYQAGGVWPSTRILTIGSRLLPTFSESNRRRVEVTAKWGWPLVPSEVQLATLYLAADLYRRKDAPFGVIGWGSEMGVSRIGSNPMKAVAGLLEPYRKSMVVVA
jgi:hypothetical protein